MTKLCRHCGVRVASKPRGLCYTCYNSAARHLYPLAADRQSLARRGSGVGGDGREPRNPTTAAPGSDEKIRVMAERASRGEGLFHPLDGQTEGE